MAANATRLCPGCIALTLGTLCVKLGCSLGTREAWLRLAVGLSQPVSNGKPAAGSPNRISPALPNSEDETTLDVGQSDLVSVRLASLDVCLFVVVLCLDTERYTLEYSV